MVTRDASAAPNLRVVLAVWLVVMAALGWGCYHLFADDDESDVITHGDPTRHVPVHLVFSGQLAGVMTRADNVAGQTALSPDPVEGFIPLTACAVATVKNEYGGTFGEILLQGVVAGKAVVLRVYTDFRDSATAPTALPTGVYELSLFTPVYPNIYVALDSQDGSISMHHGTLGSTVTVASGGRSGTLRIGLSNLSQKGPSTLALVTVTGSWSCG